MSFEQRKDLTVAAIYTVLATISFSIMSAFVKYASNSIPTSIIIFSRFFIGLVLLFVFVGLTRPKTKFTLKTQRPWLHLIRGLSGLGALSLLYFSIKHIPLVNAVLLLNTYPLFMPIVVWVVLGIKTPIRLVLFILVGFVGVIFVLKPGHDLFQWPSLLGLLSGICATVGIFSTRLLSKTEKKLTILIYFFL